MAKLLSRTSALKAARKVVSDLTLVDSGNGHDAYGYMTYDADRDLWVMSGKTYFAQARINRSHAIVRAAIKAILTSCKVQDGDHAMDAETALSCGTSAAEAVDAARMKIAARL